MIVEYTASYDGESVSFPVRNAKARVVDSRAREYNSNTKELTKENFEPGSISTVITPHHLLDRFLVEFGKIRNDHLTEFTNHSLAITSLVRGIDSNIGYGGRSYSQHLVGCAVDFGTANVAKYNKFKERLKNYIGLAAERADVRFWIYAPSTYKTYLHVTIDDKHGLLLPNIVTGGRAYANNEEYDEPARETLIAPLLAPEITSAYIREWDTKSQVSAMMRPGAMRIGDVWLSTPPERIDLVEDNQKYELETIRSIGNPKVHTNRMTSAIRLDLKFVGDQAINTELRPILAMFARTPFVTIRNSLLQKTLLPEIKYGTNRIVIKDNVDDQIPNYDVRVRELMTAFYGDFNDNDELKRFAISNMLKSDRYSDLLIIPDEILSSANTVAAGDDAQTQALISRIKAASERADASAMNASMFTDAGEVQFMSPATRINIDTSNLNIDVPSVDNFNISNILVFREGMLSDNTDIPVVLESMAASRVPSMIDSITVTITARIFNHMPYSPQLRFIKDFDDVIKQVEWLKSAELGDPSCPSDIKYTTDIAESIPFVAYYAGELERNQGESPTPHRQLPQLSEKFDDNYTGAIKKLPRHDTGELDANNISFLYRYNKDDLAHRLYKDLQSVVVENEMIEQVVRLYNKNREIFSSRYTQELNDTFTQDTWGVKYAWIIPTTMLASWWVVRNPFKVLPAAAGALRVAIDDLEAELNSIIDPNSDINRTTDGRLSAIFTTDMNSLISEPLRFDPEKLNQIAKVIKDLGENEKFQALVDKLIKVRDEVGKFNTDSIASMEKTGVGARVISLNGEGWDPQFGDNDERLNLERQGCISKISDTYITGMSLSNNNKITPIPIQGYEIPSFQHFGRGDWKMHITFSTGDPEFLAEMRILTARAHATEVARMESTDQQTKYLIDTAVTVANPWINMFGIRDAVINSVSYATVPGQIDRYEITMQLTQADFNLVEAESLKAARQLNKNIPGVKLIKLMESVFYESINAKGFGDEGGVSANNIFGYNIGYPVYFRPTDLPVGYDPKGSNTHTSTDYLLLKWQDGDTVIRTTRGDLVRPINTNLTNDRNGVSDITPFRFTEDDFFPFQNSRRGFCSEKIEFHMDEYTAINDPDHPEENQWNTLRRKEIEVGPGEIVGFANVDFILRNSSLIEHGDTISKIVGIPGMRDMFYVLEQAIIASNVVSIGNRRIITSEGVNFPSVWEVIRAPIDTATRIMNELSSIMMSLQISNIAKRASVKLSENANNLATFRNLMTALITSIGGEQQEEQLSMLLEYTEDLSRFNEEIGKMVGTDLDVMYPDLMLPKWNGKILPPDFYFYITGNDMISTMDEVSELIQEMHDVKLSTIARSSMLTIQESIMLPDADSEQISDVVDAIQNSASDFMMRELHISEDDAKSKINLLMSTNLFDPSTEQSQLFGLNHYQLQRISEMAQSIAEISTCNRLIKEAENTVRSIASRYNNVDADSLIGKARMATEIEPQSFVGMMGTIGDMNRSDSNLLCDSLIVINKSRLSLSQKIPILGYLQSPINSEQMYKSYGIVTAQGNQISDNIRKLGIQSLQNQGITRMIQAFPTVKVYFVEEDDPRWISFDDYFDYNAIYSVDIVQDEENATDVCVLTISNLTGAITDSAQNRGNESFKMQQAENSIGATIDEYNSTKIPIQVGTKIMVRLGYGDSVSSLPMAFIGAITNITPGEIMEITAQSYGYELTTSVTTMQKPIKFGLGSTVNSFADLIYWLFEMVPGMEHFGRNNLPMSDKSTKRRAAEAVVKAMDSRIITRSKPNPRDENIMLPGTQMLVNTELAWNKVRSWFYDLLFVFDEYDGIMSNEAFNWSIFDETTWEVIRDITKFQKDYIATILPYNDNRSPGDLDYAERSTIYVGPKHGYYKYTDKYDDEDMEIVRGMMSEPENELTGLALSVIINTMSSHSDILDEPISERDVNTIRRAFVESIEDVDYDPTSPTLVMDKHLIAQSAASKQWAPMEEGRMAAESTQTYADQLSRVMMYLIEMVDTPIIASVIEKDSLTTEELTKLYQEVLDSATNKHPEIRSHEITQLIGGWAMKVYSGSHGLESYVDSALFTTLKNLQLLGNRYDISQIDREWLYGSSENIEDIINRVNAHIDMQDNIYTKDLEQYIKDVITQDSMRMLPRVVSKLKGYRPVINYYTISSSTDIITNTIMASAESISNRVIMDFATEPMDDIYDMPNSNNIYSFEANVSDNIDPYDVRTKRVFHNNIDPDIQSFLGIYWGSETPSKVLSSLRSYTDGNKKLLNGETEYEDYPPIKQDSGFEPSYYTVANNLLRDSMKSMYTGSIIIVGNPNIKPFDVIYVHDFKNNMHGPVWVRRVIHRFSRENGFTTEIVPGLVSYNRGFFNAATAGEIDFAMSAARWKAAGATAWSTLGNSLLFAGSKMALSLVAAKTTTSAVAGAAVKLSAFLGGWWVAGLGLTVAAPAIIGYLRESNKQMWMQMSKLTGRNSMFMVPLWYKNEPYVAGVRGYRLSDYRIHTVDGIFKVTDILGRTYPGAYNVAEGGMEFEQQR